MPKTKFHKFTGLDGVEYSLSMKEKLFCEKYLEAKGNGVEAVFEAGYKPKNARVASSMAYNLLIKVDISAYITTKLEEYGFNDDNATKQHLYLMNQFGDLPSKRGALDMFYKLGGKYKATEIKIIDDNEDITDEAVEKEIARREKLRKSGKKSASKAKAKSS